MDEVLKAIESSAQTFREFRQANDERLNDIERSHAKILGRKGNAGGSIGDGADNTPAFNSDETKGFVRYMKNGDTHELKALATSTNSGADGGYAVPKEINAAIESILLKGSPIRRYSTVVQAVTGDYHKLVSDRGWAQGWAAETAARTSTTTAKLTDVKVPLFEQYAFPQATQVMLDDVFFDAGSWIASEIGLIFSERESSAFVSGDGTTQPSGILTAPVAATADYSTRPIGTIQYLPTGAASTFITGTSSASPVDVLVDTIAAMKPGYRANGGAQWFMHPTTLAFLAKQKDQQGRFIVVPNLTAGQPQTLLGYEVVECEHWPVIATNAFPVMFANLRRGYLVVDRPGVSVLRDPFTNKPYVGFYSVARVGGEVVNSETIKLVKCATS